MRRSQISFFLTLGGTLLLLLGLLVGWLLAAWQHPGSPATRAWWVALVGIALAITLVLLWLYRFTQIYFFHIKALITTAQLILHGNPQQRLTPVGPRDLRALSTLLNEYADRLQALGSERDQQVQQARADLEKERNLLAALMADLSDGVVVCNRDGRILLYNARARILLATPQTDRQHTLAGITGGYVGLGRSIFGLLDRHTLTFGLNHLQQLRSLSPTVAPQNATSFITTAPNGALLRTQMSLFAGADEEFQGFVLLLQDMTARLTASRRRDILLQRLTERTRGGLGNMRAAIELLQQFPSMPTAQAERFQAVIAQETTALSDELDQTMRDFANDLRDQWHVETISGSDLLWAIEHQLVEQEAVQIQTTMTTEEDTEQLWLRIDSYVVVHGLATAIHLLQQEFQTAQLAVRLQPFPAPPHADEGGNEQRGKRFAALDVSWSSRGISTETWFAWQERLSAIDATDATLTLREVAAHHGSEVWFQRDPITEQSSFRLLLPLVADTPMAGHPTVPSSTTTSRPHYYDFDLFAATAQSSVLHERPLAELAYTVFDTETTGLDPQRDEIVAIGAIRMLNRRLLHQEVFDQLIDPGQPIPRLATTIHGIGESMVQGQPMIDVVLPQFARFAEETVLVGHNLAFDLRMFAAKAAVTGVQFTQPVLDTLLLSTVLHPDEKDHSLEGLAERLGINVLGRHTALADALVTAEIFLRMIPLLRAQGIITLANAIEASKQSHLAQLRY